MKIRTHTTYEVQDVKPGDIFQCVKNDERKALTVFQLIVITGPAEWHPDIKAWKTLDGGGEWSEKGLSEALTEGSLAYVGNVSAPGFIVKSPDHVNPYVS